MPRFNLSPGRRWLFPALVLVLVLGHACELPAFVSSHGVDGPHHSGHGHADAEMVSCDGAGLVSNESSSSPVRADLDVSVERAIFPAPLVRSVASRSLEGDAGRAARPPLFLLFASLLI